jgi:hypothetical protein
MTACAFVLTDARQKALCDLIGAAFVEIRSVSGAGNAARAADLADVFLNVPAGMRGAPWWNPMDLRNDLLGYQRRYAHEQDAPRDYVSMFDTAFGEQFASEIRIAQYLESRPAIRTGVWRSPNGVSGLLFRVVSSPASGGGAAGDVDPGSPVGEWFYSLVGRADGSQWSLGKSRFPSVDAAVEDLERTCPGIAWDA